MIHVIDKATGQIVEICTEGSDVSRYDEAEYLMVSYEPAQDPSAVIWDDTNRQFIPIPEDTLLPARKQQMLDELLRTVNIFISTKPNGKPRYDQAFNANALNVKINCLATSTSIPQPIVDAETWVGTVQGVYYTKQNDIINATTTTELDAIDISYQWFEERYGVDGSVSPDPDVHARDFLQV